MTLDEKVEILAQAIWREDFQLTTLEPRWLEWSAANERAANAFRRLAAAMLGAAEGHKNHSLGWLV
jgi:hypothetical protein